MHLDWIRLLRQCIAVRDQAWQRAIPYAEYAA